MNKAIIFDIHHCSASDGPGKDDSFGDVSTDEGTEDKDQGFGEWIPF